MLIVVGALIVMMMSLAISVET